MKEIFELLKMYGGTIVSSNNMTVEEINESRAGGRFQKTPTFCKDNQTHAHAIKTLKQENIIYSIAKEQP